MASSPISVRRKLIRGCLALTALGGLAAFFLKPTEPAHSGKTLSQWLEIAERLSDERARHFQQNLVVKLSEGAEEALASADEAIRRIGSKAVPVLIRKLESDDHLRRRASDRWNSFVIRVLPTSWYARLEMKEESAFHNHQQALHGFRIIRANGNSAVPQLKEFLAQPRLVTDAASCLAYMQTPQALNALASGLASTNQSVRLHCLDAMRSYEDGALRPFSKSITRLTDDADEAVAALALGMIDGVLTEQEVVQITLPKLKDSRMRMQFQALMNIASGPEPLMPAIAECLSSRHFTVREFATNRLLVINPYRASEFGVITNGIRAEYFESYHRRASKGQTTSLTQ